MAPLMKKAEGWSLDTRIAVNKYTLRSLRLRLRGGETYNTLLRRMLVSYMELPLEELSPEQKDWVVNPNAYWNPPWPH